MRTLHSSQLWDRITHTFIVVWAAAALLIAAEISTWFLHLPTELWTIRAFRVLFEFLLAVGLWSTIVRKESLLLSGESERKLAETRLREQAAANEFLATLIRSSSQPLAVGRADGSLTLVNPAFERLTGYSAEELKSIDWVTVLTPPEWRQPELDELAELHRTGQPVRYEKEYVRKDGARIQVELLVNKVPEADGKQPLYYAFISDITERKLAQNALAETTRLLELSYDAIFVRDKQERISYWNQGAVEAYGYTAEEALGRSPHELLKTQFPESLSAVLDQLHRDGRWAGDLIHTHKDGRKITVASRWAVSRDAQGNIDAILETNSDITEQKKLDQALRASLERLERVLDVQTVGVMFWDLNTGCMIDANDTFLKLMGYNRSQVEARELNWQRLTPPEYMDISRAEVEKFLITGRVGPYEKEYFRNDGSRLWLLFAGSSLGNNQCVEFCVDISGRKKAEAELLSLIRNAPYGVYRTSVADGGRFVFINPAMLKMLGYDEDEAMGLNLERDVYANPSERLALIASARKTSNAVILEQVWRRKNGKELRIRSSGRLFRDERGHEFIESIAEDITEQRNIERQFYQAQKMEAIGRLAGGIAHDFNNILGIIVGYSDLALEKIPPESSVTEYLTQIKAAARRSVNLTRQLLMFSRKETISLKVVDLNSVISNMMKMLTRTIGEDVSINFKPGNQLGHAQCDVGQMEQVLMNLVVNARDAMPEGGTVTIETRNIDLAADYQLNHEVVIPGPYVMLSISDTGVGMDKETMSQIFEPFFTTKEMGKGTGLGLATVYGIIKRVNGYIWVYSEPDHGATFKIYLPQSSAPLTDAPPPVARAIQRGTETILVVEDDPDLLTLTTKALQSKGYKVLAAEGSAKATQLERTHYGIIHLLLTDVIMPNGNGAELALGLKLERPDMKVVFMSGYTGDVLSRYTSLIPGAVVIEKPFSWESLLLGVQKALAEN